MKTLAELLDDEEGYVEKVYLDSKGIPTCGRGHALHVGSRVPKAVCEIFFKMDMERVESDYQKLGLSLDPVREVVVKAMLFQMGLEGVLGFKNLLLASRAGKWKEASEHMIDSVWARKDSPARAKRMAKLFLEGVD